MGDLVRGDFTFLWALPKAHERQLDGPLLEELVLALRKSEFDKELLLPVLRDFSKKNKLKFGQFMKSLRIMLSSAPDGYPVAEMMEVLGKKKTLERLQFKVETPLVLDEKIESKG